MSPNRELRTNNHNGKMGATFRDNFVPLQVLHASEIFCGSLALMTLTWLGRLAMPMPSKEGAGMADIVDEGQ
jgi:hypothetical protein